MEVSIKSKKKYGRAVALLVKAGGTFQTKPTQRLIVEKRQFSLLVESGLVPKKVGQN